MEIRTVTLDDCQQMSSLAQELGYPFNSDKMHEILQLVLANRDHDIFVAEIDQHLAGYVHLVKSEISADSNLCEIAALLVNKKFRGKGVGNAFVQKAEDAARVKHATHLRIRSTLISPEAYKFFENRGFVNLRRENVYIKELV
jgi:predicted N-acetyltransferase YhbS